MASSDIISVRLAFPTVAAGTDEERGCVHGMAGEWRLTAAKLQPCTTTAVDASNYTVLSVKAGLGGTSLGTLSTETTVGAALTAGTVSEVTLSGGTALEFGADDPIYVEKDDSGTGAAADGEWTFILQQVR
jgi:hypothetical protein|uniref:Uncharacterized protein n=1 Tax=uncultured marine virus TaxID=186617 RepID=A0A0F7L426_9VIRU|nr:hypothetical protein [uncultured marine virus]